MFLFDYLRSFEFMVLFLLLGFLLLEKETRETNLFGAAFGYLP